MKQSIKLSDIKKDVESKGGSYKKCKFYINNSDAYKVNDKLYTKDQMIELYLMGEL